MIPDDQPPIGIFVGWGLTLTEPLMSLRARNRAADRMAQLHVRHPQDTLLFYAGVCADMIGTLPDNDPWRHLSGRFGDHTTGPNPPDVDGVVGPDGKPFGTWHDAADLSPLLYATPADDPGLAALVDDDLTPAAGAVLAAAGGGWESAYDMARGIADTPVPDTIELARVTDLRTRDSFRRGMGLHRVREGCEQAVRWAAHRRRSYMGPGDVWLTESVFRWGWRACRSMEGKEWPDDEIVQAITDERVRAPFPGGLGPLDPDEEDWF